MSMKPTIKSYIRQWKQAIKASSENTAGQALSNSGMEAGSQRQEASPKTTSLYSRIFGKDGLIERAKENMAKAYKTNDKNNSSQNSNKNNWAKSGASKVAKSSQVKQKFSNHLAGEKGKFEFEKGRKTSDIFITDGQRKDEENVAKLANVLNVRETGVLAGKNNIDTLQTTGQEADHATKVDVAEKLVEDYGGNQKIIDKIAELHEEGSQAVVIADDLEAGNTGHGKVAAFYAGGNTIHSDGDNETKGALVYSKRVLDNDEKLATANGEVESHETGHFLDHVSDGKLDGEMDIAGYGEKMEALRERLTGEADDGGIQGAELREKLMDDYDFSRLGYMMTKKEEFQAVTHENYHTNRDNFRLAANELGVKELEDVADMFDNAYGKDDDNDGIGDFNKKPAFIV